MRKRRKGKSIGSWELKSLSHLETLTFSLNLDLFNFQRFSTPLFLFGKNYYSDSDSDSAFLSLTFLNLTKYLKYFFYIAYISTWSLIHMFSWSAFVRRNYLFGPISHLPVTDLIGRGTVAIPNVSSQCP